MNYSTPITVQLYTTIRDSLGQTTKTVSKSFTVGADIRQASGIVAVSAAKETETVNMFFDLPKTPNTYEITISDDLITPDGVVWRIFNVDKYSRDNSVRITATVRR